MEITKERKELIRDKVKAVLGGILFIVLCLLYWFGLLMIISIFLINIWRVTWDEILVISLVLTGITSLIYFVKKIKK